MERSSAPDDGDADDGDADDGDPDDEAGGPAPAPAANGPSSLFPPPNPSTCLHDGVRKIDFVLVYEEAVPATADGPLPAANTAPPTTKQTLWRQRFLANLERVGLEMEEVITEYTVIF